MTDHLIREAEYAVYWGTPRVFFSQWYATEAEARRQFDVLRQSPSITHASIVYRGETLASHDYDPYAWHDVRKAVGR
jgi:hypothetical protein